MQHQSASGGQTRQEIETVILKLTDGIERAELYKQGATLLRRVYNLLETEDLSTSFLSSELQTREPDVCRFQTEAEMYEEDE